MSRESAQARKRAARAGAPALLAWRFDRVLLAHGLIERDARATVIDAFAHALRPGDVSA